MAEVEIGTDVIVQDIEALRVKSNKTSARICKNVKIFARLEKAMNESGIKGCGLAAIQIGVPLRASIIRMPKLNINLINPQITERELLSVFPSEGCYSFPGQFMRTMRYARCTATWLDETGEKRTGMFEGVEAIVLQHEVDHMDGTLIFDRKPQPVKRKEPKVGRNDPCPCRSGKKYKRCCL